MRGDAPRRRTLEGPMPLGPMPCELALEVAVLSVRGWARRKSLGVSIQGQTDFKPPI